MQSMLVDERSFPVVGRRSSVVGRRGIALAGSLAEHRFAYG
jgi:hypothetical protein